MRYINLFIILLFSGCGTLQSKNEYSATLSPRHVNPYIVDFKWHQTYALDSNKEKAIEKVLVKTGLMPSSCSKGIKLIRGGETEGGWGWAEFTCK